MKNFKHLLLGLLTISLASCASGGSAGKDYMGAEDGGWGGYAADAGYGTPGEGGYTNKGGSAGTAVEDKEGDLGEGEEPGETEEPEIESRPTIAAGQLTCSALNDNLFYDYWKEITSDNTNDQQGKGPFYQYRNEFDKSQLDNCFVTYNRVKLTINNANDIYVTLKDEKKTFHVDNFHNAYLFPKEVEEEYEVTISYLDKDGKRKEVDKTVKDNDEIDLENEYTAPNNLEIMFVIDATGSMGDEMEYIKSEIDDVIGKVKEDNPETKVSLAMMVYRDVGDDYVTRYSDFTTNITSQQNFLKKQKASGGGDFPEAVDQALNEAVSKQWSSKGTKLLFLVADAPAHDEKIANWSKAATKAAEEGIQIMTVAASGIDKKTEFLFRSQSLLTGGEYIFLTDDSGIGESHEKPTIKEKLIVEYLNDCLIRIIDSYHQGKTISPTPYSQVGQQQIAED